MNICYSIMLYILPSHANMYLKDIETFYPRREKKYKSVCYLGENKLRSVANCNVSQIVNSFKMEGDRTLNTTLNTTNYHIRW